MIKAVLFDMDGTITDTMGYWEHYLSEYLRYKGIDPDPDVDEIAYTCSFAECRDILSSRYGLDMQFSELSRDVNTFISKKYQSPEPLKPGAKELVAALRERGYKTALATASPRANIDRALKGYGLAEQFDAISVSMNKGDPESYLNVAKTLGVPPENCLVAEDQILTGKTVVKAGMKLMGVYDRVSVKLAGDMRPLCDIYFDDLSDTAAVLKAVESL